MAACLILSAPIGSWLVLGLLVLGCGAVGLAYCGLALRSSFRDGLVARLDLEDCTWYVVLPVMGYLAEAGSGTVLAMAHPPGCALLAASLGALLVIAVHNAWDITVWTLLKRRN